MSTETFMQDLSEANDYLASMFLNKLFMSSSFSNFFKSCLSRHSFNMALVCTSASALLYLGECAQYSGISSDLRMIQGPPTPGGCQSTTRRTMNFGGKFNENSPLHSHLPPYSAGTFFSPSSLIKSL